MHKMLLMLFTTVGMTRPASFISPAIPVILKQQDTPLDAKSTPPATFTA